MTIFTRGIYLGLLSQWNWLTNSGTMSGTTKNAPKRCYRLIQITIMITWKEDTQTKNLTTWIFGEELKPEKTCLGFVRNGSDHILHRTVSNHYDIKSTQIHSYHSPIQNFLLQTQSNHKTVSNHCQSQITIPSLTRIHIIPHSTMSLHYWSQVSSYTCNYSTFWKTVSSHLIS